MKIKELKLNDFNLSKIELSSTKGGASGGSIGQTELYTNFIGFLIHTGSRCDTDK